MKSKIFIGKYNQKIYRDQYYRSHRLDGPAIEYPVETSHFNEWWVNGNRYTEKEYNSLIKLKVFW